MELIVNAFLVTVGVGLGCLTLVFLVFLTQLALMVFLDRTERRNRR
jgi:energy-converting hydrogenase Eha subunit E